MAKQSLPKKKSFQQCSVSACTFRVHAKGLCSTHHSRYLVHGDPNFTLCPRDRECSIKDCHGKHRGKGFCYKHYRRFVKYGNPNIRLRWRNRPCSVEKCANKHQADGLCRAHWNQSQEARRINQQQQQFWARVDKTPGQGPQGECWEWQGCRVIAGYGRASIGKKQTGAHRVAWFYKHGEHPKQILRHKCDNPPCVNPDHLLEGTHADNMRDKVERKRHRVGGDHPLAKLSDSDVANIREQCAAGVKRREIARQYNISTLYVSAIKCGRVRKTEDI